MLPLLVVLLFYGLCFSIMLFDCYVLSDWHHNWFHAILTESALLFVYLKMCDVRFIAAQLLESYAPKRKMPYNIYIAAGLGAVKQELGLNAKQIADNMLFVSVCVCADSRLLNRLIDRVWYHSQGSKHYHPTPSVAPMKLAEGFLTPEATKPEEVLKGLCTRRWI